MQRDVAAYFEQTVIPLIAAEYPQVASEMCTQVSGSYGLEVADGLSDLDAMIYLDDPLWRAQGGQVQLLVYRLPPFAGHFVAHCETPGDPFAWPVFGHSEINVHPLSWLLDKQALAFLESTPDPPWGKVSIESLYELQTNLVLRDPQGIFRQLRQATAPERYPSWLWKKLLISKLVELKGQPWDFEKAVARERMAEAQVLLGDLLKAFLQIGFIISERYYPWHKYLWFAFAELPLAPRVLPHFQALVSSPDWRERVTALKAVISSYTEYILGEGVLTAEVLENLFGAKNGEAWHNPDWRDRPLVQGRKAEEAGYDPRAGWVWGLWGWA